MPAKSGTTDPPLARVAASGHPPPATDEIGRAEPEAGPPRAPRLLPREHFQERLRLPRERGRPDEPGAEAGGARGEDARRRRGEDLAALDDAAAAALGAETDREVAHESGARGFADLLERARPLRAGEAQGRGVGTSLLFRSLFHVRRIEPPPRAHKWDALPDETVLLCPNHQSYLDPAFVQLIFNRRVLFVMTDAFYRKKAANVFFRLVGALPVAKGRMTWSTMRRAIALLRCGRSLVVFPEGRLSTDGELSPAQRGVAVIARRAGVRASA